MPHPIVANTESFRVFPSTQQVKKTPATNTPNIAPKMENIGIEKIMLAALAYAMVTQY